MCSSLLITQHRRFDLNPLIHILQRITTHIFWKHYICIYLKDGSTLGIRRKY